MKLKATVFSVRGIILTAITDEAQELSYIDKSLQNIGWKSCHKEFFYEVASVALPFCSLKAFPRVKYTKSCCKKKCLDQEIIILMYQR